MTLLDFTTITSPEVNFQKSQNFPKNLQFSIDHSSESPQKLKSKVQNSLQSHNLTMKILCLTVEVWPIDLVKQQIELSHLRVHHAIQSAHTHNLSIEKVFGI